jgi:type IV fimbrial biogenesis protein FimT
MLRAMAMSTAASDRIPQGFSLVELATALAVAAILAGAAVPGLQQLHRQMQLNASAHALVASLHQARSHATSRSLPVAFCQTDTSAHCSSSGAGWQVFIELHTSSPVQRDGAEPLLSTQLLPQGIRLLANRNAVTYWPQARAGVTSTFTLCDSAQLAQPRAVIVSQTGRPRFSRVAADGGALRCPAV